MLTCRQKPDDMDTTKRFLEIQTAFTGTQSQTGPPVDDSRLILDMHFYEKHGDAKILDKSRSSLLPGCAISFLDSQINGTVFMMMRSWGRIPINPTRPNFEDLIAAVNRLQSVQTFGGFLVDTMGFGKTYTALLFLA